MHTNQATLAIHRNPADPLRACVHDLRNLFAVVASAKSLLERPLDEQKTRVVLDALGRVAIEGKIVTDALLGGSEDRMCGSQASTELQTLIPIIRTIEHAGLQIDISIADEASWILLSPAEYRAVVLELVTNAGRAGASRIQVRAARRGFRYWLIVADDGAGFGTHLQSLSSSQPAGLHGTGMRRLIAAVRSAHGRVRIRSKAGRGSVVALTLPIIRIMTAARSAQVPSGLRLAG